jgi:uncharacterized protein YciI
VIIIELTYKKPLDVVEEYLNQHRVFLEKYYALNIFFNSGPKVPRTGGIILANTDVTHAKLLIQEDPFFIYEIADFKLTEFTDRIYGSSD